MDSFVETVLIPEYTRGVLRAANPQYLQTRSAIVEARKRGDRPLARALRTQLRSLPSKDLHDPGYRRLRYTRYADDVLLGFAGPKTEAEAIKARLATFLRDDLKLQLSQTKTLVTHARTSAARFLGYEITVQHTDTRITQGRRATNGRIGLRVPLDVIKNKCAPYLKGGQPARQPHLHNHDDHTIITTFGAKYRGIIGYYLLAGDVWRLNRLRWVMETSMLKTLAGKHDSTVTKMARKYKATIDTPHGPRICFQHSIDRGQGRKPLVARFGGIPLKRQRNAVLTDREAQPAPPRRKELITRLLANRCEICASTDQVQVHQVRKLADLDTAGHPPPTWANIMANRRRKTLVVCGACHDNIHTGQPTATLTQ